MQPILVGGYPIGDCHQSMVTMVIQHGTQGFYQINYPAISITRECWLPPMHGNHGNCRLPGNLPGEHIYICT
jgi:hypothetical protein